MRTVEFKEPSLQALRTLLAAVLLSGLCFGAAAAAAWLANAGRLQTAVLAALPITIMFAVLFRRVRSEDRIARLEAALCREQHARSQADHALAEADLLLARLTSRSREGRPDPAAQLASVHGELVQLQRQSASTDPELALRLELLCMRVERAAAALRHMGRAAEPG